MKKYLLIMGVISCSLSGQVAIGTSTPDPNSDLTLGSPNKGLMLNKVTLLSTTDAVSLGAFNTSKAGMIVYNSATTGDVTPGFYMNDGTKWNKMLDVPTFNSLSSSFSTAGSDWKITGNSAINPTSNFLGTIDSQPLVVKTNATEAFRVSTSQQIGIGTTTPQGIVDITSTNSGLIIPRNTDPATNIGANSKAGMLAYNSTTNNLQFSDGTNWMSPWKLDGNSGATTSSFVGTTNSIPLVFKTNATEAFRVSTSQQIGIGTTTPQGIVDITSTSSTIVLPRNANPPTNVTTPVAGMVIYDSANKTIRYYDGTNWSTLISSQTLTTANEGVVKLNSGNGATKTKPSYDFKTSGGVNLNTYQQIIYPNSPAIDLTNNFSAAPTTSWPENATAAVSNMYNTTTNKFLENPINGQVHTWRVIVTYSGKNNGSVGYVTVNLTNPLSGFSIDQTSVAPSGQTSGNLVFYLMTIADGASIGNGYTINIKSDTTMLATIDSITRVSAEKD